MAKKNLINKMVVFSEDDPFQMELLEHASRFPNFSGYIKRLIQRDKEGGQYIQPSVKPAEQPDLSDIDASAFV